MQIQEARQLKKTLLESFNGRGTLIREEVFRPRTLFSFQEFVKQQDFFDREKREIVPPIGLGLSKKGEDWNVAVRIQERYKQSDVMNLVEEMREALGEKLDILFTGDVHKQLCIGDSVAHRDVTAGTLGGFVRKSSGSDTFLLSNNHVFADENRGQNGDEILHPSRSDGGSTGQNTIAHLSDFIALRENAENFVDVAIASIAEGTRFTPGDLGDLGQLAGVRKGLVNINEKVRKNGRTTKVTSGTVSAVEMDDVLVKYDTMTCSFGNQFEIKGDNKPFSKGGDSGALVVDSDNKAVALIFAGDGYKVSYANPIDVVLKELDLKLLHKGNS